MHATFMLPSKHCSVSMWSNTWNLKHTPWYVWNKVQKSDHINTEQCLEGNIKVACIQWNSTQIVALHNIFEDCSVCTSSNTRKFYENLAIECTFSSYLKEYLHKSRVWALPNFSMTDYTSQGKTRPMNPVDLSNCRSHQSYYTCLSKSATASGTVIVQSFFS